MTTYGYVSGDADSDIKIQESALKKFGCDEVVYDSAGQRLKRNALIKTLVPGDLLIVWRLDKFASSVRDLSDLFSRLKINDIDFKALQEDLGIESVDDRFQSLIDKMAVIEEDMKA